MTQAEKIAEEWWIKGSDEYDGALFSDKGLQMLKELIPEVAERTLEEVVRSINEQITIPYGHPVMQIVRSCRWWEEEV